MNERVKDLALSVIVENVASETWVFTDEELTKFAELIVQECCNAIRLDDAFKIGRASCRERV